MKKLILMLVAAWIVLSWSVNPSYGFSVPSAQQSLARFYFAGTTQLAANTNAAKLKTIWELPASVKLREQTLSRLARAPQMLFQQRVKIPAGDYSDLFYPLWVDLLQNESFLEIRGRAGGAADWTLAVRLESDNVKIWDANLRELAKAWKLGNPADIKADGATGWEVKMSSSSEVLQFLRSGSWCVISLGPDPLSNASEMARKIHKDGRPETVENDTWLKAEVDLPRLLQAGFPVPFAQYLPRPLPAIKLALSSKADNVRSQATLSFSEPQRMSVESWRIPAHTIYDPLISFTAIQGIAPYLQNWSFLKQVDASPSPNQLFVWAQAANPFLTYAAAPMRNVTNLFDRLVKNLPSTIEKAFAPGKMGELRLMTNKTELIWTGLPIISPFLCIAPEPGGDFLLGGFFASPLATNPPPAELFAQITGRTNLIYYDWEVTQDRLAQVRVLASWYDLLAPATEIASTSSETSTCAVLWLNVVGPNLGNTVTEVTVSSPNEWNVTRKSHIGLSSIELVALSRWLDHAKFPLCGYSLPPLAKTEPEKKAQQP